MEGISRNIGTQEVHQDVYIYIYLKCILATNKNKLHNVRRCLFNKLCEYRRFAVPCWIESQGGSINGEIFFFFFWKLKIFSSKAKDRL